MPDESSIEVYLKKNGEKSLLTTYAVMCVDNERNEICLGWNANIVQLGKFFSIFCDRVLEEFMHATGPDLRLMCEACSVNYDDLVQTLESWRQRKMEFEIPDLKEDKDE